VSVPIRAHLLRPLVHFALIGATLFLVQRAASPEAGPGHERIVVDAHRIAAARRAWIADTGRAPDPRDDAALVAQVVDEEVLLHTARRLGFHRTDPVVWRRLVENMRFVSADPAVSDADLHAEALRLRMDESDLVVRRRLTERAMQAIRRLGRGHEPAEDELRDFVARHPERFSEAPRVAFAQVFLSREHRGDRIAADAAAVGRALAATSSSAAAGVDLGLGDPSPFPSTVPLTSQNDVAKMLGPAFAAAVMAAPPGRWNGPLPSAYGLHFVFVREARPAALPPFEAARSAARYAVLRDREERALTAGVRALRERYDVRVGEPDGEDPTS
jgi:hypothetical protein